MVYWDERASCSLRRLGSNHVRFRPRRRHRLKRGERGASRSGGNAGGSGAQRLLQRNGAVAQRVWHLLAQRSDALRHLGDLSLQRCV